MTQVSIDINGRRVERAAVLQWEDRRIDAAAKKLGVTVSQGRTVDQRREELLATKLELGADEILRRLAGDVRRADRIARRAAPLTKRRVVSSIEMFVPGASADDFVAWFQHASAVDPAAMLRACPDHFMIRDGVRGQEVLETTGGSPFAALFTIDYDDTSSLRTPADPQFSRQVAGVARASDGTAVGGVRHQFRNTASGYHARLSVEFPLLTLPTMASAHRWHLACEFSNWAEAAANA